MCSSKMLEPHCQNLCEGDRKSPGQVLEEISMRLYNSIDLHIVTPKWHALIFLVHWILIRVVSLAPHMQGRQLYHIKSCFVLGIYMLLHILWKTICLDLKSLFCIVELKKMLYLLNKLFIYYSIVSFLI